LICWTFLSRNRLDLIQVDQIEPFESLHRFQMCFNKAILFYFVIILIPSPVVLILKPDQRKDLIICSTFLITCPGKRKKDAQWSQCKIKKS
jgi:hypothetical protein